MGSPVVLAGPKEEVGHFPVLMQKLAQTRRGRQIVEEGALSYVQFP